jgi:hypothetical protein
MQVAWAYRGRELLIRPSKYERILILVFFLTLPLSNPWVHGDGVGYYAFARSLLIEHDLNFKKDWLAANASFRMGRRDADGNIAPEQYTGTGHLDNHFSIGPAVLWSPFLITAHLAVLSYDALGGHVSADGYSRPYVMAMALGTALYGFAALWISFRIARKYLPERWAFLATLGIWFASSLPVYMYFNPSWSHAHSAFMVGLFLWYWDRTRVARTWLQWVILGGIAGLMIDVYYVNGLLLILPLFESLTAYWTAFKASAGKPITLLFLKNLLFAAAIILTFLPTLIVKKIIYGSYLTFGYEHLWVWTSPAFFTVCFSSQHGLFSWTPILVLAVLGLWGLRRHDRTLALYLIVVFVAFLYTIGCYGDWHGISSFGNRFFISLTPLFILGLAAVFDWLEDRWHDHGVFASIATMILIAWNLGLVYQWGTHLIPVRGPISWREAAYNQVVVVPFQVTRTLKDYLTHREQLMNHIEHEDIKQIDDQASKVQRETPLKAQPK